jgi:hypothetical protein
VSIVESLDITREEVSMAHKEDLGDQAVDLVAWEAVLNIDIMEVGALEDREGAMKGQVEVEGDSVDHKAALGNLGDREVEMVGQVVLGGSDNSISKPQVK